MNILWLAAYPNPQWPNSHPSPWMTTLAAELIKSEACQLTIASYSHFIEKDESFNKDGIQHINIKVRDDKLDLISGYSHRIKRMKALVSDIAHQFDLLHIHGIEQQYHSMAVHVPKPKLISIQGIAKLYCNTLPLRPDYRHLSWRVAGYYEDRDLSAYHTFICRTHWDKSYIINRLPDATIYHNWEIMREIFYQPIALNRAGNAIVFVGGLNSIKGICETLQAFKQLLDKGLSIRLIVAGGGSYAELVDLAKQQKLSHSHIAAIEHRRHQSAEQLWHTYQEAICLVHPSYIDNSPNSVCEAQLAGLPVIASNVGGVSSLIEHQETGLFTSLQPESIAKAVLQIIEDEELRQSLSEQARQVALLRHDKAFIVNKTLGVYSTVSAERSI